MWHRRLSPDALRTISRRLGPIDALSLRACCKRFFKIISRDQPYWYCMVHPVQRRYHVKKEWSIRCADRSWDNLAITDEERCRNVIERLPDPPIPPEPLPHRFVAFLRRHHQLLGPVDCGRTEHYEQIEERIFRPTDVDVTSTDEGLWIYQFLFQRYKETKKRKKFFRDPNVIATKRLRLIHEKEYHQRKIEQIDEQLYWFNHADELQQLDHKKSAFFRKSAKIFDLGHPIIGEDKD